MSETTPPPEDHVFPKVFNLTRNCYTDRGKSVPPGSGGDATGDYAEAPQPESRWDEHLEEEKEGRRGSDQQFKSQVPKVFVSEGIDEQAYSASQPAPSCCDTPDSESHMDDHDDEEEICSEKVERDSNKLSRKAAGGRRGGIRKKSGDDVNAKKLKQQFQTTAADHNHQAAPPPPPPPTQPLTRTPSPRWQKKAEGIFYKVDTKQEEEDQSGRCLSALVILHECSSTLILLNSLTAYHQ